MLLQNKNVVLYGGGGSVGTAMAFAFAQEGVRVFLTDHTTGTNSANRKSHYRTGWPGCLCDGGCPGSKSG